MVSRITISEHYLRNSFHFLQSKHSAITNWQEFAKSAQGVIPGSFIATFSVIWVGARSMKKMRYPLGEESEDSAIDTRIHVFHGRVPDVSPCSLPHYTNKFGPLRAHNNRLVGASTVALLSVNV